MKILVFPELRQTYNYDCGAKAAHAILAYYGIDVRESEIIKISHTTRAGTPLRGIIKTMKKHGLKCQAGAMTIDKIKKYIDKKIPVLLVLQAWTDKKRINWEKDWIDGHYVVAIGYDRSKIYFEDPSSIMRTYLTNRELIKRWHDVDTDGKKYINYGLAVYGKKNKFSLKKSIHMD